MCIIIRTAELEDYSSHYDRGVDGWPPERSEEREDKPVVVAMRLRKDLPAAELVAKKTTKLSSKLF